MTEEGSPERPSSVFVAPCLPNRLRLGPEIADVIVLVPSTSVLEQYRVSGGDGYRDEPAYLRLPTIGHTNRDLKPRTV